MALIDKETIRAEIERRIKFHSDALQMALPGLNTVTLTHSAGLKEDKELLGFLDSIELKERESDNYCKENCKGYQETGKCFSDGPCVAKQEWNEEDEKIRNGLISLIEEIKSQPLKRLEDWDGYIHFLKSLHARSK